MVRKMGKCAKDLDELNKLAVDFAKANGFDGASRYVRFVYKRFFVYKVDGSYKLLYKFSYLLLILVSTTDGTVRFATEKEAEDIVILYQQ
jgi:hypothetical protein